MVDGRVRLVESLAVLSRPSSPMFSVRLAGPVESFREKVESEGCELRSGREGALTIHGLGEDAAEHIWRWSRETGVALRAMAPATNSLEDVFLQAIRESNVANS